MAAEGWNLAFDIAASGIVAAIGTIIAIKVKFKQSVGDPMELVQTARQESDRIRADAQAWADREEERLLAREQTMDALLARLDDRDRELSARAAMLEQSEARNEQLAERLQAELAHVSGIDVGTARELMLERIAQQHRELGAREASSIEQEAVHRAQELARKATLDAMERTAAVYAAQATITVVPLPNEEMKGRIIGREGRNIRAFEQTTGVDLIVDETPEVVVLSSFDPMRRELARLTLLALVEDGRIHPARIEEEHRRLSDELAARVESDGAEAAQRAGVFGLPPRVHEALGNLRYRTSYAQNVLDHSVEVAELCGRIADELHLDTAACRAAGLLHDIGKGLGPDYDGPHALAGMRFLGECGIAEPLLNAVGAHHREIEPASPVAQVVIVADALSAARPGARRESLDSYVKRLSRLEDIANSFEGVERSYALQAGRELRLIVRPEAIDDLGAARLANEVARRVETESQFPGQVKVTVIRELRVQATAK